ncbi:hypothetical protein F2P56_010357 [Juglans regia]|uniref:Uncharacterized protein n=1 Tax=Juglans regia TaxID=51240 RepID=A0A833XQN9_JUGRE|nr:hypothetical protein F2P56_010357 [Juglans regia]
MVGETAKSGGASGDHRILAILLVMILLHKGHCGASVAAADASIFQDNVTSLIDMDEPHQWFDSEISRMLVLEYPESNRRIRVKISSSQTEGLTVKLVMPDVNGWSALLIIFKCINRVICTEIIN